MEFNFKKIIKYFDNFMNSSFHDKNLSQSRNPNKNKIDLKPRVEYIAETDTKYQSISINYLVDLVWHKRK